MKPLISFMDKDYFNLHVKLVLKYFWKSIRLFKVSFFMVIFSSLFSGMLDIYIPFQFLKFWDILNLNNFIFVNNARRIIIIIFILGIIRLVIARTGSFCNSYFQANTIASLRKQSFSYLINHSRSFFSNNFTGSLTQKINKYARAFERIMDMIVDFGIPLIIRFFGTILAIYTLAPKYAWILSIFGFVFLVTAFIYTRFKLKYDIISALADSKTTGVLSDSISNHSSIQFFSGQEYENIRVGEVIDNQKRATLKNWYLWGGLSFVQSFYTVLIEFIIFWVAIGDWRSGIIGVPVIILIQTYLTRLTQSLWTFNSIIRTFYDGFSDAQEMALIMEIPFDVKDEVKHKLKKINGEVVFENVTYIYDKNNTKVFDNFSLTIPAGQKIALVGTSGAGKSTFVNLLMRLFNLTSGRILIDGVDIASITQNNLRENIGFVPQDPSLFHRTLMDNIRYGRRGATDEEVKRASALANCDKFIDRLPLGYDTYVGERGVKLSGGERQRVAIARAILKDAPILVLDEATSALDSESEMLIQEALHNLIKDKTTIVIAHRLSTVRAMDRIIVIEEGKIIEDDNHDELVNKEGGIYKRLWDIQSGGFDVNI